ncbi:hypothetical protein [Flectobacillus roseus]|uniref:hypothetical protein n=1 Tax=Flectobacillus roseus TaxID=502259 RepID=UPI0024B7213E|nr:hypothetical protein [Flectobacillus roseus]MDI9870616.1 hypothetical protein [Flectobacillus roseus]
MNRTIIVTVGTSLCERNEINTTGLKGYLYNETHKSLKKQHLTRCKKDLLHLLENKQDNTICAELQSIAKIRESNVDIEVYLICTDTILSPLCAEFIAKRLINNGISVKFECNNRHIIEGLIVDGINASTTFEETGFPNLIQTIKDIEKHANEETRPILNISGGYKALIPVMTIMGQLYDMEINYMYEDAEELIKINSLPINFDWDKGEFYLEYIKAEGLKTIVNNQVELDYLRSVGIIKKNQFKLSILGELFREYLENLDKGKKSTVGRLIELKVYQYFIQNYYSDYAIIQQGKAFFWSKNDRSQFYEVTQFDNDGAKEHKIDIDIWLKDNANNEIWCEVKSFSERGMYKANKQIATILDFIKCTQYTLLKEFRLIVYKLPKTSITKYSQKLNEIKRLFQNSEIQFNLFVIELSEDKKGQIDTKKLFESSLTITPFEL